MILSRSLPVNSATSHFTLYILFYLSGVSALIYQVMWQRMLYGIFGVDLTSITIIVSVFMFGLGIGGLLGGRLADYFPNRLLQLYIVIELVIAIFGFASPAIIEYLGFFFFSSNQLITGIASFVMLAVPTIMMGATFPILVTHVNKTIQHIGDSVGGLYFANTLGGAMGAYLAGFVLLSALDIMGTINYAAMLNLSVAFIAFIFFRRKN